jgi:hypothetical protein
MTEPEQLNSTLPKLDQTDDPRGGAVVWALLVVGTVLVASLLLLAVKWAAGAW